MGCVSGTLAAAADLPGKTRRNSKTNKVTRRSSLTKDVKAGGIGHAQLIMSNSGKITDFYDLGKRKLGEGAFGSVRKAKRKGNQIVRAVKTIPKTQIKSASLRLRLDQEIAIMKLVDHPNIIKLYEHFEDRRNIYLVMELCKGGELFDRIIKSGHFKERQAATLMQQIIRALYYMHENYICHRDLKPENFLFVSEDPIESTTLKIIDFGLARKFESGQVLRTKAGTPYYVAPQVLAGKYDQSSDMWSCGVIMYIMLCGYPPFYGKSEAEVLAKVRLGKYTFKSADWQWISEDAKALVRLLLNMNPHDRYTAEQALNHVWIRSNAPRAPNLALQPTFVDNLRKFRCQNKLKKAALHIIAGQLNEKQIKALRETFISLDCNGDGLLTAMEMKEGLAKADLKEIPVDLQQILEDVDSDGSGVIDYTEFLAATMEEHLYIQEDVCWSAFQLFDRNGDGQISKEELDKVLKNDDVEEIIDCDYKELMAQVDSDGDGKINFEEFMKMMHDK